MNVRELFNKGRKNDIWERHHKKFKKWFKSNLILLKTMDENPNHFDDDFKESSFYRLNLGYYGVGFGNGFASGLESIDASKSKSSETTRDHWNGAKNTGKEVVKAFRESKYNIDWMVNEWLYDNIHLWATIKVTKEEHKKENIIRNQHTLEEKNELKHYAKFSGLKQS